ncbi:helix-turn-helix domain-containing protein [Streptomyces dysideae]|uniref:Uncharacterized protein n=1 Tax=Streptomyces dysideae TaxID=909626 RepID=A0A117S1P9_9ACTN|nr:helix-turn-helix domain-containing protein [Streptomyces dysideae]KUO21922.1 hypothetical protein AQJ91_07270 [Streptomyces dysideae]
MKLLYNYRIHPNSEQEQILARFFGCARVVHNDGLRMRHEAYKRGEPFITDAQLQKLVITAAKGTGERQWLKEAPSVALVQSLGDLHAASRNFFAWRRGDRKGPKVKGMGTRRGRLGKSVHDQSLGVFARTLEAKCHRYGRAFIKVDRWFPSTQLCSPPGYGALRGADCSPQGLRRDKTPVEPA